MIFYCFLLCLGIFFRFPRFLMKIPVEIPQGSLGSPAQASVKDKQEDRIEFAPEFLNSIEIADLPPYGLKLMNNTIILAMRNCRITYIQVCRVSGTKPSSGSRYLLKCYKAC